MKAFPYPGESNC